MKFNPSMNIVTKHGLTVFDYVRGSVKEMEAKTSYLKKFF